MSPTRRVGVISDTHNLLRPSAVAVLHGCDHIIHAGDICSAAVLDSLRGLAPVTVVRGNNDKGDWAHAIRQSEIVEIGGVHIYVIHDIADIDLDPLAAGIAIVISGHSHRPKIEEREGVLYLNPGSAGPRRFRLPISVAEIEIAADKTFSARLVDLE